MRSQNDNNRSRMTRKSMRRKHLPFYKKKSFIISFILILVILIGIFIFWKANSSKPSATSTQPSHKIEKVTPKKKATKKKKAAKKKAAEPKKVTKEEPKTQEATPQPKVSPKANPIKNAGSYNNLTYDTDWYTFKISNEVKLVKDASGNAALMVKYNYTNKTQSTETPQKVQENAIMLKQDGQELTSTTAKGDDANLVNTSNNGLVQPNKSFDGALLYKVNNTDSDVTMYFKNIQTNGWLDTTQPLKLK